MLNNKWLAIGLSIAAVALVLFRLVFRSGPAVPTPPPDQPSALIQPRTAAPATTPGAPTQFTVTPETLPGIDPVDTSSDLLLSRIDREIAAPVSRRPLGTPFGHKVFSLPVAENLLRTGEAPAPAPEFTLQGTVSEGGRRVAVINHQPVRTGETVAGAEVVSIEPLRVVLRFGTQLIELFTTPVAGTPVPGGRETP
jgi:hypothetical protein